MPGRDGTGPSGFGGVPGRGAGLCSGVNTGRGESRLRSVGGRGFGLGLKYGCGRGRFNPAELTEKEQLSAQKDLLETRLNTINKQLDKM